MLLEGAKDGLQAVVVAGGGSTQLAKAPADAFNWSPAHGAGKNDQHRQTCESPAARKAPSVISVAPRILFRADSRSNKAPKSGRETQLQRAKIRQ